VILRSASNSDPGKSDCEVRFTPDCGLIGVSRASQQRAKGRRSFDYFASRDAVKESPNDLAVF
jgi:hypothetical protein